MDYTSRMAALLGRFRRERNGVVADTMQYRGKAYGLNYGVSLPTIRAVARAERPDSDFARFLYRQDVRELKLAAFWIADPVQMTSVEFSDWGEGIANSEMAEECAFALMSRSPRGDEWGRAWCDTGNELLGYAGLLALSRIPHPDFSSLVPVLRRQVVKSVADIDKSAEEVAESFKERSALVMLACKSACDCLHHKCGRLAGKVYACCFFTL